ncbi:predicted protein [Micromonas commoda]|uniref:J domain-containing protein n=1 Tax=Micromonas commoda (strain RCC299 / NOUM17 / CCMP2709) TaxID=296587 RepID=C1EH60_MICCC|nr:predicted protein [Micromonas commoda]ACO67240.1 predicted protein [Micromonas commoda]|eukprot:XP_002505982.1 predicted protein [Micromonas commoda]
MWRSRRAVGEVLRAAARRSAGPRCLHRPDHLASAAATTRAPRRVDIDARRPSPGRESRRDSLASSRSFSADASPSSRGACWSCGVATTASDLFFCGGCGGVLPALAEGDDVNGSLLLFRVLGVDPPRFAVSNDELERAMKNLQKTLHPDKFSTAPNVAREHSADQASLVNRAYATLRDPLRRAKYMLRAFGAGVAEESGMGDEQGSPAGDTIDPTLLMDVMETREAIERAGDDASALGAMATANDAAEHECVAALGAAMDAGDLATARKETVRLTYLVRIRDEIKRRLPPG